jgi:antitoxin HicB
MTMATTLDMYVIQVKPLSEELGGGYEALFPQLARGVVGYGNTQQEAINDLMQAAPAFAEAVEESGQRIPAPEPPRDCQEFSGKFNVRVPKLLHAMLVRQAEEQDVSLNSLVQTILTAGTTALAAGHEFGAIVEREPAADVPPLIMPLVRT